MFQPYLYRLTEKSTGRWYVGSRTSEFSKANPSDLGVTYFTSSKTVSKLFKSDPSNFKREILLIGSVAYVVEMESALLRLLDAKNDDLSFNQHNGDGKMNTVKSGKMTAENKLGFHAWSFEEFSKHNAENGKRSFVDGKGVHGRSKEKMSLDGLKSYELRVGVHSRTKEQMSATGKANALRAICEGYGVAHLTPERRVEIGRAGAETAKRQVWVCDECGFESRACGVGLHQKAAGHSGKTRII